MVKEEEERKRFSPKKKKGGEEREAEIEISTRRGRERGCIKRKKKC